MKKLFVFLTFVVIVLFYGNKADAKNILPLLPEKGTYDCSIDNDKLILIVDYVSEEKASGIFVQNRGKAAEDTHTFMLNRKGGKWVLQSDLYSGSLKGSGNKDGFVGQVSFFNKKKKFLFFYQKGNFELKYRTQTPVLTSDRYQKEIFDNISVQTDIKYGKALGYWTHNPYNNEPYIDVISRGINTTLRDPDSLDLKMDIYQPVADTTQKRPLVLLIHGGAFYIGTKQCPTMKILATTLAKRGFVVASIDYRMGFRMRGSDIERSGYRAVQDAHAALRFLSHFASKYKIDPSQVYVGGTSAGAIATLNLAFMDNDERPESVQSKKKSEDLGKIESSGNKYTDSFQIRAIVNMWGAVSDVKIIDKDENIPVLSIHGTADDIVPFGYDYPFQNSMLINRLLMDKMYGSKPITDRLNELGIENRLLAFNGLKHEPQTDKFDHINNLMDTISNNVTRFYYEQVAPKIYIPEKQLTVSSGGNLLPVYAEISRGAFSDILVVGGIKANANPNDLSVIWFKNYGLHEFSISANNQYGAWSKKTFRVELR